MMSSDSHYPEGRPPTRSASTASGSTVRRHQPPVRPAPSRKCSSPRPSSSHRPGGSTSLTLQLVDRCARLRLAPPTRAGQLSGEPAGAPSRPAHLTSRCSLGRQTAARRGRMGVCRPRRPRWCDLWPGARRLTPANQWMANTWQGEFRSATQARTATPAPRRSAPTRPTATARSRTPRHPNPASSDEERLPPLRQTTAVDIGQQHACPKPSTQRHPTSDSAASAALLPCIRLGAV
jgi:hypothetical protein